MRGFQRIGVVGMSAPDDAVTILAIGGVVWRHGASIPNRAQRDRASLARASRPAHVRCALKSRECTPHMLHLHGRAGHRAGERLIDRRLHGTTVRWRASTGPYTRMSRLHPLQRAPHRFCCERVVRPCHTASCDRAATPLSPSDGAALALPAPVRLDEPMARACHRR